MNDEQKAAWNRLTQNIDINDYFSSDNPVRILTDCPPTVNPIFDDPRRVNSMLRKNKYPEITTDVLSKISRYATAKDHDVNGWAKSLWYLAVKYGYDTVEEILDRIPKEKLSVLEIEDFVKLAYYYDEMKHYPLQWTLHLH